MTRVYLVWHTNTDIDTGSENEKLIGVYTDRRRAKQAIARLSMQPGFNRSPDRFEICMYPLNVDHWTEGFGIDNEG